MTQQSVMDIYTWSVICHMFPPYSWSGVKDGSGTPDAIFKTLSLRSRQNIRNADVLIIDEISMISANILEKVSFHYMYLNESWKLNIMRIGLIYTLIVIYMYKCPMHRDFLKITIISHGWDFSKLGSSRTDLHLLCLRAIWNSTHNAVQSGFQSSWGDFKCTHVTVLAKYGVIFKHRTCKHVKWVATPKWIVCGTCEFFS